jgi:hypothetical protein
MNMIERFNDAVINNMDMVGGSKEKSQLYVLFSMLSDVQEQIHMKMDRDAIQSINDIKFLMYNIEKEKI